MKSVPKSFVIFALLAVGFPVLAADPPIDGSGIGATIQLTNIAPGQEITRLNFRIPKDAQPGDSAGIPQIKAERE